MSLRQSGRGSAGFRRVSAPRIARPRPLASYVLDQQLVFYGLKDEVLVCRITCQTTKTYQKSPQRNLSCPQTPCTLDLLTPVRGFRLTMPRHGMSMCAQIRLCRYASVRRFEVAVDGSSFYTDSDRVVAHVGRCANNGR